MPVIAFDNVSYSYDGQVNALDHINLTVEQGEYLVILGHNGSGKSTLARCCNALIVPDAGSVRILDMDPTDLASQLQIRRHVGMVFQNPDNQIVTSVVEDDVAFGPENLGVPQPDIVRRVKTALDTVAMTAYAQADPAELSGGQKQRVGIASMLAMEPDILVLDEPGAMLDPRGRRGIRRICRELNSKGITIVHITHFMDDALDADRVAVMDQGQVVLEGSPEAVFAQGGRLRSLGLEQPFAMRLATRLRELGVDAAAAPDTAHLKTLEEALCRSYLKA